MERLHMRRSAPVLAAGVSLLAPVSVATGAASPLTIPDSPQALAASGISSTEFAVYSREHGELRLSIVGRHGRRQVGKALRPGVRVEQVAIAGRHIVAGGVDGSGRVVIATGRTGRRLLIRRVIRTSEPAKRVTIDAVSVDPSGSAVVVYTLFRGGRRVLASLSRSGGPFTAPIAITERRERLAAVSAAVNSSGDAIVAYAEAVIHGRHDVAARMISRGQILPPRRFANGEVADTVLATAMGRNGHGHVAWHTQGGSALQPPAGVVKAVELDGRGRPGQPVQLDRFSLRGAGFPGGPPDYDYVYHADGTRLQIDRRAGRLITLWGAFDGAHYVVRASPLTGTPKVRTISPPDADAQPAKTQPNVGGPVVAAWTLGLRGSLAPPGASFALGFARATNGMAFRAPVTATASADRPSEVIAASSPDGSSVLLAWSTGVEPRLRMQVFR